MPLAVGLAAAQIRSSHSQRILVVGAERLSYYIDWSRRETAILFGDAAGAVVRWEVAGVLRALTWEIALSKNDLELAEEFREIATRLAATTTRRP